MPTPPSRRIRNAVLATCALGAIGVGYAGIAAAQSSSGDQDSRVAATTADPIADTTAADAVIESEEPAGTTAPSATAGLGASPTPSATKKPTAKPSRTTTKPSKRPSPKPTKSTTSPKPTKTQTSSSGGSTRVSRVIELVNQERDKAGCGALKGQSQLHAAAQKHSELQAEKKTMSHQLPGEASMGDRVTAEGYRWGGVAENVAAGYTTAASVMDGWMNSPGHKANILNCGYKHIGVGVAKSSDGTLYWTQNFASPL